MVTGELLWLIPLFPLLAFGLIVLFANRSNRLSHGLAIGGMLISWGLSMVVFFQAIGTEGLAEHPLRSAIAWFPTGDMSFEIGVRLDPLTAVALFFVAWTCLAIFVYSVGYHNFGSPRDEHDQPGLQPHAGGIEPMYARFFAFISLFAFGMLLLVLADNLLLLFVGWEIMGLCSYLLIGFWYAKESARAAMVKAFITTRVGDVFMLLGLAYLYSQTGTLMFQDILFDAETLERLAAMPGVFAGFSAAGLISVLLFVGTVGKSAQWPLHVWLPDAMEGPTPVSALIHAATMVSAGVYLIVRFFPLITAGWHHGEPLTAPMAIIAFIGALTALFAATIALTQNDIKRVLAYSTISQLGYMVAAIGIGAYVAAAFHLITHAFFKALLFLGSGSVIHGVEHGLHAAAGHGSAAAHGDEDAGHSAAAKHGDHLDPNDMTNMGGLRSKMPLTFWTFLIGGFALSGFPILTAGFWSKDEILADAFANGHIVIFGVLALAALLTAFYTMRQISLTFLGAPRTEAAGHAHESPRSMTLPLVVLSVFAVAAGWINIPEDFPGLGGILPSWLHEFIGVVPIEHAEAVVFNPVPLLVSVGAALGGLALGWVVYRDVKAGQPDPLERPLGAFYRILKNKYYFDELYDWLFVRPAYWFAEVFTYQRIDRGLIDGTLHAVADLAGRIGSALRNWIDIPLVNGSGDFVGESVKFAGREFRIVQTGRVQLYLIAGVVFAGLLLSAVLFIN